MKFFKTTVSPNRNYAVIRIGDDDFAIQDVEKTSFNLVEVLTDVPLTTIEKVIIAIFYVEDGFTYRIVSRVLEKGLFYVSADGDEDGEEYMIHLDSIPANAYFLGATRL